MSCVETFLSAELHFSTVVPGFEWTDEGRNKWGYVATEPESKLVWTVDTRTAAPDVSVCRLLAGHCVVVCLSCCRVVMCCC